MKKGLDAPAPLTNTALNVVLFEKQQSKLVCVLFACIVFDLMFREVMKLWVTYYASPCMSWIIE